MKVVIITSVKVNNHLRWICLLLYTPEYMCSNTYCRISYCIASHRDRELLDPEISLQEIINAIKKIALWETLKSQMAFKYNSLNPFSLLYAKF